MVEEFDGVEAVEVQVVGGDVTVTAAAGSARVEAEVVQGPPLDIEVVAGVLRIVHRPERLRGLVIGPRAIVSVVIDHTMPVTVRTVNADVFAAGTTTRTSLTTVSGRVTTTGLSGESSLRTVSGDIEADGVSGRVEASTVSGSITLSAKLGTSVSARSVSGDITLNMADAPTISASSVSGDVTIGLGSDATFDLDASTVSGRLDTTFPDDRLSSGRRRLRGSVGDGRGEVIVRTTSGNVAVLRRASTAALASAE